jgi:hypothetical protein
LIAQARRLYVGESLSVDLKETVYALDSTTIDLCLSLFPWAHFRALVQFAGLSTIPSSGELKAVRWLSS